VGLSRDIKEPYAGVIRQINESTRPVLAVDMPSGISADTGQVLGVAVRAAKTVTFAFAKTGQILYPGADYCGEVLVRHVGITERGFGDERPKRFYLESADLSKLPPRHPYSNKGTYGKALLVAGQRHMAGAACLAGEAAYRMGCGLVKICTESCNREIMQTRLVEALFSPYDEQPLSLEWPSAIGIGPGLGTDDEKWEILKKTLTETVCPVVVDADGLNLLAGRKEVLKEHKGTVLVTPHIGEMMRLTGKTKEALLRNLPEACRSFAEAYGVICILKDTRTVISDGKNICINRTGCDGMATGGSGDVLTGMITGLLASGMDGFEAACLAVWIHGKAGEEAAGRLGRRGMLAGDLLDEIPKIMQKAERGEKL
jgi:NAD(P)H-hydrate epimerase